MTPVTELFADHRGPVNRTAARPSTLRLLVVLGVLLVGSIPALAQQIPGGQQSPQPEQSGEGTPTEPPDDGLMLTDPAEFISDELAPTFFLKAAEAYQEGQYPASAAIYRRLILSGFDSADLRYNLGNALLRSGELARAISEYLRAQVLAPRDQDVRANLTFARSTIKDLVAPPQPAPWSRTLFFWHYGLSMAETLKLLVGLGVMFWSLVAFSLLQPRWRPWWPRVVLLVLILALTLSVLLRWQRPQRVAVVLPAQADVFSGTDLQSRVIFNLHAGTELRVTNSDEAWTQFEMPGGQRGWLPTEQLVVVDPSWLYQKAGR